ncbi:MAG: histidine kinase dimerization/phospho-acceptor domain-containing protein [Deltaproteobacteria bacterium]
MSATRAKTPPGASGSSGSSGSPGSPSSNDDGDSDGRDPKLRALVHDVRNSLTTIKLAIQALSAGKEPISDRARRRLEIARREVDKIAERLQDFSATAAATASPGLRDRPEGS